MVQITASPSQLLIANPIGGAIFIFGAKIGRKSTKNVLFCILFRPMGSSSPPPPGYATATKNAANWSRTAVYVLEALYKQVGLGSFDPFGLWRTSAKNCTNFLSNSFVAYLGCVLIVKANTSEKIST